MNNMETISVALVFTIIGGIIGFLAFTRGRDKDIKCDGEKDGVLSTKLDYISQGVDDIKLDVKVQGVKVDDINNKVIKVEESTKSAHKRIDDLVAQIIKKEGM